ncbi:ATP-binding protein [Streptomyces sp. NPDC002055]|uniref:ATP-binding protein n=1 Tax=Streptomyces sp. NPDC002055 TaxID=3154534 RepID=UPI00331B4751
MLSYGCTFVGRPEEMRRARNWTRDVLVGSPQVDDAALIVTELGANALLHTKSGTGTFHVTIVVNRERIAISVTDSGGAGAVPRVERPSKGDTHGRGLGMVTALADRVEIDGDHRGHTVTAHLIRTPVRRAPAW